MPAAAPAPDARPRGRSDCEVRPCRVRSTDLHRRAGPSRVWNVQMPELVLGPLLRYVGDDRGDRLGGDRRALRGRGPRPHGAHLQVEGHHYALVAIEGLEPGHDHALRGAPRRRACAGRHPGDVFPPCVIRTRRRTARIRHRLRLLPRLRASRAAVLPEEGRAPARPRDRRAVRSRPAACADQDPIEWPHVLLWLGDQVYADEVSPAHARLHPPRPDAASRRDERGRRLRGVHAPLPRLVAGPGDPLAAVDGRRAR